MFGGWQASASDFRALAWERRRQTHEGECLGVGVQHARTNALAWTCAACADMQIDMAGLVTERDGTRSGVAVQTVTV